jgi:hypothetical protein
MSIAMNPARNPAASLSKTTFFAKTIFISILSGFLSTHTSLIKAQTAKSDEPVMPTWVNKVELSGALFHRSLEDQTIFNNSTLGLIEASYAADSLDFQAGIVYENNLDREVRINSLSVKSYHDNQERNKHFDYQIGKFVTKVGVLDYLSLLNNYNIPRVQYYDEANPNVRYAPAWMGRLDIYPNPKATASLILQPFDAEYAALWGRGQQFGLNAVVPYLLTNTGDEDLNLIGNVILVPVYENGAKSALNRYLDSKTEELDSDLYNSSMGVSYLINQHNNTYGVSFINGVSKAPLIKIDQNLLTAIRLLTGDDKQAYLDDFVLQANNEPIKSIEYFRYNQLGLFYETSLDQFGLRGEISYQDKFPLLNELSNLTTFGLGLDHQGWVYNNFEVQYFQFNERDVAAYYGIWSLHFDPVNVGSVKVQLKNTLAYGNFENTTITTTLPSLTFSYQKLDVSLEYLAHSRQEFTPDTASISVKLTF